MHELKIQGESNHVRVLLITEDTERTVTCASTIVFAASGHPIDAADRRRVRFVYDSLDSQIFYENFFLRRVAENNCIQFYRVQRLLLGAENSLNLGGHFTCTYNFTD
jgi:hypothetical protein